VLDAYLDGSMLRTLKSNAEAILAEGLEKLRPEEAAVMAFLQERLKKEVTRRDLAEDLAASLKQARKRGPAGVRTAARARPKSSRSGGRSGAARAGRPEPKRVAAVAHKKREGARGRRSR
jgi:DNA topoisomerase-1